MQLCVWMAGGRSSEQSGNMTAQSVVEKNCGHRGWRHEGAVTMPTERIRRARRWWQAVAATAGGCMRGQHPALLHLGSNRIPYTIIVDVTLFTIAPVHG